MNIPHNTRLWLIPLALAWIFDQLFWKRMLGISYPIFVLLCLAGGLYLVWSQGKRPVKTSLLLLLPVLFFAGMFAFRQEPVTTLLNVGLSLAGLAVLAVTLLGGQWLHYSVSDYVAKFFLLATGSLVGPLRYFFSKPETEEPAAVQPVKTRRWILPVVRGLLLALPVVALLAALLASADPIFSKGLQNFLSIFQIEKLGEYIFRAFYILVLAFLLLGVFLHSLTESQEEKLIGLEKPWLAPFLGSIETTIILASVNLLFLLFVAVQFRYFFGGQANIHLEGFTYAEYARRGFSELVAVAFISLVLFLGLSGITRREEARQRSLFTGLGILLVLQVIVILVSAFQRLLLYESAYGFSRVRTYTHVFIVWLALLLVVTIVLEMVQHPRYFALAAVLAAVGFGLTLNIMKVDAFIAQQNVNRALQGQDLDGAYLASLSSDVTPTLVQLFISRQMPAAIKDQLGAALSCRLAMKSEPYDYRPDWMSFHFSYYNAARALQQVQPQLAGYPVTDTGEQGLTVQVSGLQKPCASKGAMD